MEILRGARRESGLAKTRLGVLREVGVVCVELDRVATAPSVDTVGLIEGDVLLGEMGGLFEKVVDMMTEWKGMRD